jgi:hypothetical protein
MLQTRIIRNIKPPASRGSQRSGSDPQVGLTQNYPIRGQNILVYMYIVLIAGRVRRKYAITHGKVQAVSGFSQVATARCL